MQSNSPRQQHPFLSCSLLLMLLGLLAMGSRHTVLQMQQIQLAQHPARQVVLQVVRELHVAPEQVLQRHTIFLQETCFRRGTNF